MIPPHRISPDQDSDVADRMHPSISEEAQDFIMSSDGDTPGNFLPPPHIAARIYKNRSYHRKSSAASSRRNSMTSHQSGRSGRSALSAHGGPQSTHIAQYLRRASIIETRKAKAADRNAHAEKVRLRAALNKAAPRMTTTDSEEKAIAAQQARERYLAQVKANCAAEVRRSKKVAEEQRERRAAEHLKLKEDMEERQAQAERRRALHEQSLRRPRTATQSEQMDGKKKLGYVWKPRNELEAAMILQNVWRRARRRRAVRDFLQLELTVANVEKATFEDVGELLSRDDVIQRTRSLLGVLHLLNDSDDATQDGATVRMFLTTFLILGQPTYVLSKDGEQEKDLVAKAQELLQQLNRTIEPESSASATEGASSSTDLPEAFSTFKSAFSAWRSDDSSFMIKNMVAQFAELDAIWQTVKGDTLGEVAADYKEGIRHNQTLVMARLKKLAGPERTMKLIRDAVRRSRKAKAQKQPMVDNKPRAASEAPITETASSLARVDSISSRPNVEDQGPEDIIGAKQTLQSSSFIPDSRIVVHELAINKEWKLDVGQREAKRDEIIQNTTTQLKLGLDAGLDHVWIPAIAESISQKLSSVLAPGKPTQIMVQEALDPEMVRQQVQNGSFSYQRFFDFMDSILPKLCAPVRDDEVKGLAQNPSDDPVKQLARIYFVVELLVLDVLNFQLESIAPQLLQESTGYESRAFEKRLGGGFPDKTLQWWRQSVSKAEEAPRRTSENSQNATARVTPTKIYMQGLVDITIPENALEENEIPETLELDQARFSRLRSDILRLATISSILLNAKNLLRRDTRSLWKAEAARMWELPYSSSPAAFVSVVESRYALPPTTKQQLTTFITRILSEAREGQANHPVMKVLLRKIKSHVLTRLSAASSDERIRASTTATEVLGSGGMPEFVGRIGDIVQELSRVADVDRQAHGEWYDRISAKVAEEQAVAAAG